MAPKKHGVATDTKPLCFIAMPFGTKKVARRTVEFDVVLKKIIEPAIVAAGMEPLRADQEVTGGIIHKPMFERLLLCPYAVVDITLNNANVLYEAGVRHTARPRATVMIRANDVPLPFDLGMSRFMTYRLGQTGRPTQAAKDTEQLATLLQACREDSANDSPLYQLLTYIKPPGLPEETSMSVASDLTEDFRKRARYSEDRAVELSKARALAKKNEKAGQEAIARIERSLENLDAVETGVMIDVLLSYRAVNAFDAMIAWIGRLPEPVRSSIMVREQLGLALNRVGRGAEAEKLLLALIDENGPSSETLGVLGRVYKDRWEAAKTVSPETAGRILDQAIDVYLRGFETDWRDHYPGINAVTLMEHRGPSFDEQQKLIPVVRYSVERRLASGAADYWDYATLLELNVLARDKEGALKALKAALSASNDRFTGQTTARNLGLIRTARSERGERDTAWIKRIEDTLRPLAAESTLGQERVAAKLRSNRRNQ